MPQRTPPDELLTDAEKRLKKLAELKPFLNELNQYTEWEIFRPILMDALGLNDKKPGNGGRPRYDVVFMFKILVLQALYNLSDEEMEYQILDRLSFMKFLGLELHDNVPDARTIWLFREALRKAGVIEDLFKRFDTMLSDAGFAASGGQMIDASFVEAPIQRNTKEENEEIKNGNIPKKWSKKKIAHKDTDARWTKKNNKSYYGYKNHANVDRKYKIIRHYTVTPANVHDSQEMDNVIDSSTKGDSVWADSAYRSAEQEERLKDAGLNSQVHERPYRNTPLTEEQKASNTEKSKVRARVEHVFGHIQNTMNGCFVRTIGIVRAKVKIGLENLAYNISRFTFLMRSKEKSTAT